MRKSALLFLLSVLAAAFFATAAPAQIIPAQFARGVITQIDRDAGTFRVGDDAYHLRRVIYLNRFQSGEQVDVTFIVADGRREVISMQRVDRPTRNCIFEPLCFTEE